MTDATVAGGPGLLERLVAGPVICAEGYLFEIERRGYLSAGAYVPEAVLDHPEVVAQLHRDFLHAGSDVMLAFTYYAHREKLRVIGKEDTLEEINRTALRLAREAAQEGDALVAGNVCNSNIFVDGDAESARTVRAMFDEQVAWAVDEGVDFIVAETISFLGEALLALDAIKAAGQPAVINLAVHRDPNTRDGSSLAEAAKRLEDAGADVVGLNCARGPASMLPLLGPIREAVSCHVAALPVAYRTSADEPTFQSAQRSRLRLPAGWAPLPDRARSLHRQPLRDRGVHQGGSGARRELSRGLLRRRSPPHPRRGGSARPPADGEQVLARHDHARLLRHVREGAVQIQGVLEAPIALIGAQGRRSAAPPARTRRMLA